MDYQREIEYKFTVSGMAWSDLLAFLDSNYNTTLQPQTSHDLYWKNDKVDFIRLRENSRELTVKLTDMGTIVNRVEENVVIADAESMAACERMQTLLNGPAMKLTKTFAAYEASSVIVCAYTVHNDPLSRIFL